MKVSQKSLEYRVLKNIQDQKMFEPGDIVVAAVSGGADSMCLLAILLDIKDKLGIELKVCHYNHRMRGEASYNDAKFVESFCQDRGAEFVYGEAEKDNIIKSEEDARTKRYEFFEKILEEGRGDKVALAHNSNDYIETFLLRLARGSGIKGLSSIPSQRKFFFRPLLPFSRKEIEGYLAEKKIAFVTDQTNKDTSISRNFIRLKMFPLFLKLNPSFEKTAYASIRLLEEDLQLLTDVTAESFRKVCERADNKIIMDRNKFLQLPSALAQNVLRSAIADISSLKDVTQKQLSEVMSVIKKGEGKKHKLLPHSLRVELVSGKIILYIMKKEKRS